MTSLTRRSAAFAPAAALLALAACGYGGPRDTRVQVTSTAESLAATDSALVEIKVNDNRRTTHRPRVAGPVTISASAGLLRDVEAPLQGGKAYTVYTAPSVPENTRVSITARAPDGFAGSGQVLVRPANGKGAFGEGEDNEVSVLVSASPGSEAGERVYVYEVRWVPKQPLASVSLRLDAPMVITVDGDARVTSETRGGASFVFGPVDGGAGIAAPFTITARGLASVGGTASWSVTRQDGAATSFVTVGPS